MREKRLIIDGNPCDTDFYDKSIQTVVDAQAVGRNLCPKVSECQSGALGPGELQCVMLSGIQVAREVLKGKVLVDCEIEYFRNEAELKPPKAKGYMDTRENNFKILTDWDKICDRVAHYANVILDLKPEDYRLFGTPFKKGERQKILKKKYPILNESIKDPETGEWMHSKCGVILLEAKAIHPIHDGPFPFSGSGRCWTEIVPFCPKCQKKPSTKGIPTKSNPYEDHENEILRRIRDS